MKKLKRHPETMSLFRKLIFSIIISVAILLVASIPVVFFSGVFRINDVSIVGNNALSKRQVYEISGIQSHWNLLTLPAKNIKKNLVANQWIKNATVEKNFFHRVVISIEERVPIAFMSWGQSVFLMDSDSFVVERATGRMPDNLVEIKVEQASDGPVTGEVLKDRKICEAIKILKEIPHIRSSIKQICPDDDRGYVLVTKRGYQIIYGDKASKSKSEILEAIMTEIEKSQRPIIYLDIRVLECPVIKPC
ncbi:MAG: FtsQ-type POTRA domain-containing protein [Actinomycetota bacterium]|nr:FtsQ-type POTRA domain-containing protein [Actinomycetota bacterium]